MAVTAAVQTKYEHLRENLRELGSVAVAFSGGVDSTLLCWVAHDVLGEHMMAVTAASQSFPLRELDASREFCEKEQIRQEILVHDELAIKGFRENPVNRCYLCKQGLFSHLLEIAGKNGIAYVAEGSNTDDLSDYRPGMRAIRELGIKSPLREAGLSKGEIRELSHMLGLPTWDKPSFACLASRFVYGETITEEKMDMVGKAEALLVKMGQKQMRVRIHGKMARIELMPDQIEWAAQREVRETIVREFKKYGFHYVTLDLQGYRTGSMNEELDLPDLAGGA